VTGGCRVELKLEKTMTTKTYKQMYEEAARVTGGKYKGYTDGNALSLYVDDKYGVNAAADSAAHDALVDALQPILRSKDDD
jgi:hypothetical protein